MANHIRQQLREAVATTLTSLTTTGANVFQARLNPLQASELPALRIYTEGEQVEIQSIGYPARQERRIALVVEGVARQSADTEDKLDTISKEVEAALGASLTTWQAGGIARGGVALESAEIGLSGEGDLDTGVVTMRFTAICYTMSNAPDVAL